MLLSLVPDYCESFIPLSELGTLPKPLTDLFMEQYLTLTYQDLLKKSEECFDTLAITTKQAKNVEEETKKTS